MDLIKIAQQAFAGEPKNYPNFKAGDTITVTYKIKEGDKERLQKFRGVVIQQRGTGATKTFTIRKISNGVGVERVFPIHSPNVDKVEVIRNGRVRRGKLYYLRDRVGKAAKVKEQIR